MKPNILKYLPCNEGLTFYEGKTSFKEAWESCPQGDWMLWIAKKLEIDIRILTLAKAYCAKTVYHLLLDEGSQNAIVVAINFGKNLATDEELDAAAADVAADVAYAAYAKKEKVKTITSSKAYEQAKIKNQLKTADVCRKYLTKAVFEASNIT